MKNNIIMVVAELEDGREHIHAKQHKPIKYNLNDSNDLKILKEYKRLYVKKKEKCYSKDLTMIYSAINSDKNAIVFVKRVRYEPYDENLHIPYRTFSVMFPKQSKEELN